MGKVVDSSKDKMYVGQFQESGHVASRVEIKPQLRLLDGVAAGIA